MIDSILNLLFRCPHKRLTRPVTPIDLNGKPSGQTYVACLDCGKHFAYDAKEMHIGKPLPSPELPGGPPPDRSKSHKSRLKLALGVGVPLGILAGSVLSVRKAARDRAEGDPKDAPRD